MRTINAGVSTAGVWLLAAVVLLPAERAPAAQPAAEERQIDDAIVRALEFLAREQGASGAWRIEAFGESTAATSLAVMAFLAAGHVPGEGPYGERLERGIQWVIEHQHHNGMLVHRTSHGPMYCHGISTLMLAEVVGMLDKEQGAQCRRALERAVRLILRAQNVAKAAQHAGGWRYSQTSPDSDLSVSAWQLLALRAARNVGCDVPAEHIDRAVEYVRQCSVRGNGGFAYQPGGAPTATRNGTGILALEICGRHRTDEALGAAQALLRQPLAVQDPYFYYGVYYCTLGMFQVGGEYWDQTKAHVNRLLLEEQKANGSWSARPGRPENTPGAVYCTSMAVLALAVEYQFLPIYQR